MEAKMQISDLSKALDFKPRQNWHPDLPALSWGQWMLTSWQKDSGAATDIKEHTKKDFLPAFNTCYPQLSLPEIARIYRFWESLSEFKKSVGFDWKDFFILYKLQDSSNLRRSLINLAESPINFQNWISQNHINSSDIEILETVQDMNLIKLIGERVACFNPQRSAGLKALNWSCELFFMGHTTKNLLCLEADSMKEWLTYLYNQKHLTAPSEEQLTQEVSLLATPKAEQELSKETFIQRTEKLSEE